MASGGWRIFVAEEDGRIVSHVYVELVAKLPRPVRAHAFWGYVTNVYTVPERRSEGIGGKVLRAAVDWARGEGLEFLIAWPSDDSRDFYARHGFEDTAETMILELS